MNLPEIQEQDEEHGSSFFAYPMEKKVPCSAIESAILSIIEET